MAAEARIKLIAELTGLGQEDTISANFTTTTTVTRALHHYAIQDTADTDQALALGDVSTVQLLIIKCISNDVDIDLDYVSSFDADLTIQEGESAVIPVPAGVVRFKNNDAGETSTIEYLVVGT
jgi:hypothetical protein